MRIRAILIGHLEFRQRRRLQRLTKILIDNFQDTRHLAKITNRGFGFRRLGNEMTFEEAMLRIPGLTFEDSEYVDITTLYKTCLYLGQSDKSNAFIEKQGTHTTVYLYSNEQLLVASQSYVEGEHHPSIEMRWYSLSNLSSWNLKYKGFKLIEGTPLLPEASFDLHLRFGQEEIRNESSNANGSRALCDIFKHNILPSQGLTPSTADG